MVSLIRGCGIVLALGLWVQVAGAQIFLYYPSNNSTVTFEDLNQNNGFNWSLIPGATEYEITVYKQTSTGVPEFERFITKDEPPYFVDSGYRDLLFSPGNFTWEVRVSDGEGIDTKSDQAAFQLIDTDILVPTATPVGGVVNPVTPEVGYVRDVTFSPGSEITLGQLTDLKISWTPPEYPEGVSFLYDISVIWPNGLIDEVPNWAETSVKPITNPSTFTGIYKVHIRAKANGKFGNFSTYDVVVKGNVQPVATPTPVNRNPDVTRDQSVDIKDVAAFVQSFNTRKNQNLTYNPLLDFVQDEVIDKRDLLVFVQMFVLKNKVTDAPVWDSVDLPIIDTTAPFGCPVMDFVNTPIQNNTFTFSTSKCNLSELFSAIFYFKEVPGFTRYQVDITPKLEPVIPTKQIKVEGNSFSFYSPRDDNEFTITVRTIGTNQELGTPSAPLKVIVPNQP